jgi:hypothetical protein
MTEERIQEVLRIVLGKADHGEADANHDGRTRRGGPKRIRFLSVRAKDMPQEVIHIKLEIRSGYC